MRSIILAAGQGSRLRPLTDDRPKCMVELAGRTLLDHQILALGCAGIHDVTVVLGYRAESVRTPNLQVRVNRQFESTNMVASLMCAADLLDGSDDVLVSYGDLVFESDVVTSLLACNDPLCTTVDLDWLKLWSLRFENPLSDAETMRIDANGYVIELGRRPSSLNEIEAQYMGLIKIDARLCTALTDLYDSLDDTFRFAGRTRTGLYMTDFLQLAIDRGIPLRTQPVRGGWLEVDSLSDLEAYNRLQENGRLADFCRVVPGDGTAEGN